MKFLYMCQSYFYALFEMHSMGLNVSRYMNIVDVLKYVIISIYFGIVDTVYK